MSNGPLLNTDRELYREPGSDPPGDYYASSVHVTASGDLGIQVGGLVIVRSLRDWHALAVNATPHTEVKKCERCQGSGVYESPHLYDGKGECEACQGYGVDVATMCVLCGETLQWHLDADSRCDFAAF